MTTTSQTSNRSDVWRWPLVFKHPEVPTGDHPGAFGVQRKHDVHTGVDLYTSPGTPVLTVEAGRIVAVDQFTGAAVGSPWWHDTSFVMVEGASGVVCYGEIYPMPLRIGMVVPANALIGTVAQVLKKDKGRPMCMLHLELYQTGSREPVVWTEARPQRLLDPTPYLLEAYAHVAR